MVDLLFEKQDDWSQADDVTATLKGYAAELDLDADAFATCLDERKMSDKVTQDVIIGQDREFSPASLFWIFKGQQSGPVPMDQLLERSHFSPCAGLRKTS